MTALVWDKPGERRYEAGIDRGVLYLPSGGAVPWNGLVSVNEDRAREVKSYYMDGFKFLDYSVPGAYSAKLQAFTYPDELDDLIGNRDLWPGVTVYDQRAKRFNLSYRTKIGNDLENEDHGYNVHLLYNITATQSDVTYNTIADKFPGDAFEWNLYGVPAAPYGFNWSSHFAIDSRRIASAKLTEIENYIYGTSGSSPAFPDLEALATMAT